ncbi:hypothetical protein C8J55DRAFT_517824 [Lentinula edodes]|uniref:Uncharacterized protein n=1 Tax=Lentinula lateritia TaxID=40482 RepID=A0A9W9DLY7_9AGAR|nr:hypothetical protein C8J55DRAFT_517824 [Lentinula edodes]
MRYKIPEYHAHQLACFKSSQVHTIQDLAPCSRIFLPLPSLRVIWSHRLEGNSIPKTIAIGTTSSHQHEDFSRQ